MTDAASGLDLRRPDKGARPAAILWAVVGAALILDALVVLFVSSMHTGIVATFVIGVLYVFHGLSRHRTRPGARQGPARWLRILVPSLTALMLLAFAGLAVFGRMDTASQEEDAVVVLGTAVQDGDVTPALRSRLDVAVDYSVANPDAVVVVAGGLPPGETVTEALAMERYLVTRGVAEHRIIQEGRSTSTSENFGYAKDLLDARLGKEYTTAFVTSDFHVFRAAGIARAAGVRATHLHADTPWYEVPVDYVREALAIAKFVVTGR
ncbi:YdcF family protein [Promicromonospora alba]|uniref:YdcF family protein n=1 Tax=Promicromonospora alba TaxID=1616110 RepID=A0ABV9HEQ9_9MICO